jgi:hypothetical protein
MKHRAVLRAAIIAGSLSLAASPAWAGGGHHSNSAMSEDPMVSAKVQSEASRDFSSENNLGGGMTEGMDSYSKDALAESQTEDNFQANGRWERQEDLGIARGPASDEHGWNGVDSKDDRDFHS